MSNNPTMDLLTEIAEYNIAQRAVDKDTEVVEPTICLSLGTGVPPVKKVSFESFLIPYPRIFDILKFIFSILHIFFQTTVVDIFRPDNVGDTLKLMLSWDGMGKLMLER